MHELLSRWALGAVRAKVVPNLPVIATIRPVYSKNGFGSDLITRLFIHKSWSALKTTTTESHLTRRKTTKGTSKTEFGELYPVG